METLLAILAPLLKPLLEALGATLNANLAAKRGEAAQRELGRSQAHNEVLRGTVAAQQAELEAQANAPAGVDETLKRLEDGSA
jgi:hypothetical protein